MPLHCIFALLFVLTLVQPSVAVAQLTEKQGEAIINELRQIRQTLEKLQRGNKPQAQAQAGQIMGRAKVSTKGRPVLGSDDAPVTLVEFVDYQCPFCKRFSSTTLLELKKEFIDSGKMRLVMKDLALPMHSDARQAAIAAHCSAEQGKFWAMQQSLFDNTRKLKDDDLRSYAKEIGLDTDRFDECLESKRYDAAISADISEANKQGITGTPTFIIGRTSDDVVEGTILRGAQPAEAFRSKIESLLAEKPGTQVRQ